MKVQLFLAVAIISAMPFASCKKGGDKAADFANLFKNTEWTGEIKYNSVPVAEQFSAEFGPNGYVQWHERLGDYYGSYTLNSDTRELTIWFANNAGKFTATITSDNKFSNIVHAGAYAWNVINGQLNKSGKQVLENTAWQNPGGTFVVKFKPNQKLQVNADPELSYGRAGCAIKKFTVGSADIFLVLQPGNVLKGIQAVHLGASGYAYIPVECTRQ